MTKISAQSNTKPSIDQNTPQALHQEVTASGAKPLTYNNTTSNVLYTHSPSNSTGSIIQDSASTEHLPNITKPKVAKIPSAKEVKQHIINDINTKYEVKKSIQILSKQDPQLINKTIDTILEHVKNNKAYVNSEELFPNAKQENHEKLRQAIVQHQGLNLEIFEDKREISAENLKALLTHNPNLRILTCSPNSESFEDIKAYIHLNNNLEAINIYGGKFTPEQTAQIKSLCKEKGFDVDSSSANIIQLSKSIIAKQPPSDDEGHDDISHYLYSKSSAPPVRTQAINRTDSELLNHAMHEFNQYKFSLSKEQEEVFNALNNNPNAEHGSKLPNAQTIHYGFQPENGADIENLAFVIMHNVTTNLNNKNTINAHINTKAYMNALTEIDIPQNSLVNSFEQMSNQSLRGSLLRQASDEIKQAIKNQMNDVEECENTQEFKDRTINLVCMVHGHKGDGVPVDVKTGFNNLKKSMFIEQSLPFMDDFLITQFINGAKKTCESFFIQLNEEQFKSSLQNQISRPEIKQQAINYIVDSAVQGKPQIAVDVAKHQLKLEGKL